MKALFICNTFMQVIIAIQAKLKMFPRDDIDIMLSDHSLNADKRVQGLRKSGIFRRVKYIKTKAMYSYSKPRKILDGLGYLMGKGMFSQLLWDDENLYDQIYFYNPGIDVSYVAANAARESGKAKIPELVRFEEGILCYSWLVQGFTVGSRARFSNFINKLQGLPDVIHDTKKYMVFYPDVLEAASRPGHKAYTAIQIPLLTSDKTFLDCLNTVFDYDPSAHNFPQKYIYFSTSADIDGYPVGETDIILKLADIIGRDNLLVKVHPRDDRDVFERNGLPVSRDSSIPWEVMQLNHDFSKHVFISLSSGSTINVTAMKNENIPVFMLYPVVAGRDKYMDTVHYAAIANALNCLKSVGVCRSVKVTDKLGDVIE